MVLLLALNPACSSAIYFFSLGVKPIQDDVQHDFDTVSFYKYPGVYFTPKLIWSKTKEVLAHQASKAVMRIFKYQREFKLFDSIVKPIFCYGAEIWGYKYSKTIEKVHIKFCKRFVGLHQNTGDFFLL